MGTAIASASSGDSRVSWQQQPVSRGPCSAEGVPSMVSKLLSAAELTAARRSWVHGHRRLHGQGRQAPEVAPPEGCSLGALRTGWAWSVTGRVVCLVPRLLAFAFACPRRLVTVRRKLSERLGDGDATTRSLYALPPAWPAARCTCSNPEQQEAGPVGRPRRYRGDCDGGRSSECDTPGRRTPSLLKP
jgi:hypothetical protein